MSRTYTLVSTDRGKRVYRSRWSALDAARHILGGRVFASHSYTAGPDLTEDDAGNVAKSYYSAQCLYSSRAERDRDQSGVHCHLVLETR